MDLDALFASKTTKDKPPLNYVQADAENGKLQTTLKAQIATEVENEKKVVKGSGAAKDEPAPGSYDEFMRDLKHKAYTQRLGAWIPLTELSYMKNWHPLPETGQGYGIKMNELIDRDIYKPYGEESFWKRLDLYNKPTMTGLRVWVYDPKLETVSYSMMTHSLPGFPMTSCY